MRPNDFLARPERFHGGQTGGVHSHPGFHTAERPETTYPYAQQKAVPEDLDEELDTWGPEAIPLNDYPVVVTLDMRGLERLADYDAEEMAKEPAVIAAQEMLERQRDEGESIYDAAQWVCDTSEYQSEEGWSSYGVVQWLFELSTHSIQQPACSVASYVEDIDDEALAEVFVRDLSRGVIAPAALAQIAGQFRYLEDVSASRIVAVDYLQPIFPRMFPMWDDPEYQQELAEALESAGWVVWGIEDALMGSMPAVSTTVYERKPPKNARIEYHGTSYRNLVLAAPELNLPDPPPPYDPSSP